MVSVQPASQYESYLVCYLKVRSHYVARQNATHCSFVARQKLLGICHQCDRVHMKKEFTASFDGTDNLPIEFLGRAASNGMSQPSRLSIHTYLWHGAIFAVRRSVDIPLGIHPVHAPYLRHKLVFFCPLIKPYTLYCQYCHKFCCKILHACRKQQFVFQTMATLVLCSVVVSVCSVMEM